MDRISWLLILIFSTGTAFAGTVFAPPPPEPEQVGAGEDYPQSRFGMPPFKVNVGVGRAYAKDAVEEIESSDENPGQIMPGRGIAGLVVGKKAEEYHEQVARKTEQADTRSVIDRTATPASRKGVQEVALIAGDLGFFPKTFFVSRDVPVRMFVTGASKNTLCIMMDSFQVRKQVRSQKIEEITFTPNMPGKYRFYCPVNGMEGTMIVKEFASAVSAGASTGE